MLEIIISFFILSILEILLGIDNLVILSIISNRLAKKKDQKIARYIGLLIALTLRIIFLFTITWIIKMSHPLFALWEHPFSTKDLILLLGGLFLIYKGFKEIIEMFKENKNHKTIDQIKETKIVKQPKMLTVILEIAFLDTIFALDSIMTAIAISKELWVMIAANVFAIIIMLVVVNWISDFLEKNPSFKVLAICFLILVGFTLILEGLTIHISKNYLYFAIIFGLMMETINTLLKPKNNNTKE